MSDKKPEYFEIKASELQGSGDFNCPKCGTAISPEDKGEKKYRVTGTRTYRDVLASMTIGCNCGSQTKIKGLSAKPLQRFQYCVV